MSSKMKLITKRDIIRGVRDRWLGQYKQYEDGYRVAWGKGKTAGEIRSDLHALDLETCSQADVDAAIDAGSTAWAANDCDLCGEDVEVTLRMGDEPDYDARWLDVCPDCLAKAAASIPSQITEETKNGSDQHGRRRGG